MFGSNQTFANKWYCKIYEKIAQGNYILAKHTESAPFIARSRDNGVIGRIGVYGVQDDYEPPVMIGYVKLLPVLSFD